MPPPEGGGGRVVYNIITIRTHVPIANENFACRPDRHNLQYKNTIRVLGFNYSESGSTCAIVDEETVIIRQTNWRYPQ